MSPESPRTTRSLIVVSKDHGELALAMTLLRGQEFATRTHLLLPGSLYASNHDGLPVSASRYATLADVSTMVETHEPDLVFLLSAYHFSRDRLLSPESLAALLSKLRVRGCRVVTSDPFLGLGAHLTLADVDTRFLAPGTPAWNRWLVRLALRLRGSKTKIVRVPSLENATHLYPTPMPERQDGIRRVSFFNPSVVRVAREVRAVEDGREHRGAPDSRPRWLFVLSPSELHSQRVRIGFRTFMTLLVGLLRQTLEADRLPVLIAPPSVVELLASVLRDSVELLPSCPFAEFETRVLDAEYVFSWNAFSLSLLARLANELPVFFFDRGYFARTIKPFYDIARVCHLGGWEPSYLDQRQLFSPYVLAHFAKAQRAALAELRKRWEASPTPDELVDRLLG